MKDFLIALKYSFLIIGAIVGAGLASGQEIVVFFAQYGFVSIIFLFLLFILFYKGLNQFLSFGKVYYNLDFEAKRIKSMKILDITSLFFLLIIGSAMLAGVNEICNNHFHHFNFPVYSFVLILISSILMIFGLKTLLNLSIYIVPFIVVGIIYVCLNCTTNMAISEPAFSTDFSTLGLLGLSCVSYCCCNLVTSNRLLFDIGNKLNKRQTKIISIIVSFVLIAIILTIIVSILLVDNSVLYADLPLVYMAYLINSPTGICFSIVFIFSVVTTLLTTQYSFVQIIKSQVLKGKKQLAILGSGVLFFLISLIGFGDIVKYFYPIIGAFGFVMMFYLKELSFKMGFNSCNNKIHKPGKQTQNDGAGHN